MQQYQNCYLFSTFVTLVVHTCQQRLVGGVEWLDLGQPLLSLLLENEDLLDAVLWAHLRISGDLLQLGVGRDSPVVKLLGLVHGLGQGIVVFNEFVQLSVALLDDGSLLLDFCNLQARKSEEKNDIMCS